MKRALFRFDATPAIGGGHFARCGLLAAALADVDWDTHFAISSATKSSGLIPANGNIIVMPTEKSREPEVLRKAWPEGVDLLVVDHYERDAEFALPLRRWANEILTFDDADTTPPWADIAVDATPPSSEIALADIRPERIVLRGPFWAPLAAAFHRLRSEALANGKAGEVVRILISVGALDSADATSQILDALAALPFGGAVDIALTSAAPHLARLRVKLKTLPFQATLHVDAQVAALMSKADFVIGAGGGSSWERACLGKPSLVMIVADNQLRNAQALQQRNAAAIFDARHGVDQAALVLSLKPLLSNAQLRGEMASHARSLTDGLGATRLALAIDPQHDKTGSAIRLVPLRMADAKMIFDWQTAPGARAFSRNPRPPEWDEHRTWFAKKLDDPKCIFNLVVADASPVGFVRLDHIENGAFEVSILIAKAHQGRGIAHAALDAARRLMPRAQFIADILPENESSLALFRQAGYVPHEGKFTQRPAGKTAA